MAERYVTVCPNHKLFCPDCGRCTAFDAAVKKQLTAFTTPPSSHPAVTGPQVREWIGTIFPTKS